MRLATVRPNATWRRNRAAAASGAGSMPTTTIPSRSTLTMPKRRDWTQHGMEKTLEHRVLMRLRTSDGIEGWGEATSLAQWGGIEGRYYGETVTTVTHIIHDLFAPALFKADLRTPRQVIDRLDTVIVRFLND